jgi:hypothetical protein
MVLTVDQKETGKIYKIEDQNIDLETLLEEKRLYGDFYYQYRVQV